MTIKPKFNRDCPANWKDFFRRDSDDTFKRENPIAYPLLIVLGLVVFPAPMVLFILYLDAAPGGLTLWSALFGLAGGFCLGVGLFNIVAAFLGQYLGHKVTGYAICWGVALMIIAGYLA